VQLRDADLWASGALSVTLDATFELPANDQVPSIEVLGPSGLAQPLFARDASIPTFGQKRSLTDAVTIAIPRAPAGPAEFTVVVRAADGELARWLVRRTVNDPEVVVCVADLPPEVEDLAAPLTTCRQFTAEDVDADRLALPYEQTGAVVRKRVALLTRRGLVNARTLDVFEALATRVVPDAKAVTPETPLEALVSPVVQLQVGVVTLQPRVAGKRSLVDLNPMPALLAVRAGSSFEVLRDVRMGTASMELVSLSDDGRDEFSTSTSLPVRVATDAPLGLAVRFSPKVADGPLVTSRLASLRLGLRDAAGVVRTDRLFHPVRALPSATCRLEISDVDLGMIRLSERRVVDVLVRNVGSAPCSKARVTFDALTSSNMVLTFNGGRSLPNPGESATWSLAVEPRVVGPQVRLLNVFFDEHEPTQPDLVVRFEANPTP
jgi:hypothetical protein